MSKELVIGSNRHETKVAILEDDQLVEIYFQRSNEYSLAGSIHKGRVTRVLPGMQSAFVDLGLERDTFLYVSDFFEENEEFDTLPEDKPAVSRGGDRGERRPQRSHERGREEPAVEPRQALPPAPVSNGDTAEADESEEFAAPDGPEAVAAQENRPPEHIRPNSGGRTEGDRGPGGDRRGRRSRRRRGHGRDFPDTKYAQPAPQTTVQAGLSLPVAAPAEEPESVTKLEEAEEPADVMVLPGESLAKYRAKPAGEETVAPVRRGPRYYILPKTAPESAQTSAAEVLPKTDPVIETAAAAAEPTGHLVDQIADQASDPATGDAVQPESDAPVPLEAAVEVNAPPVSGLRLVTVTESTLEEAEAAADETPSGHIAAEASEIELADKIFAHREDESVESEDEKRADVAQDYLAEEGQEETQEETRDESRATVELLEVEEFQLKDASELLPDYKDLAPEIEEALENAAQQAALSDEAGLEEGSEEEIGSVDGPEEKPSGDAPAQTASVREQGGRSMHRVSRRMRRRRGGRFGQRDTANAGPIGNGSASAGAASEAAPALEINSASAAAPAVEPEAKTREERRDSSETRTSERPERVMPSISELLKAGQEIIVQIAKEPLGQKGARITSHIALPGRYVVFMPSVAHLGVSRKVGSEEERLRLKRILQTHRVGTTGGFIIRTAGEGVTEEEIAADMNFLYSQWLDIRQKAEKKPAPALLHYDLGIVQRILRDQVTDEFKAIWVDNEDLYESVVTFMQRFQPALVNRVKMYTRAAPIFDAFNITQELEKALRPKVWLKSGGYIVINQTEALVAIDINTGKYVGKSNRLEDTIVKTNIEAVKEIVRQIRLRDLGGIIVVDFIDMDERKNRQKVMQALEEAMESDKAPYKILQFNDFGLVAITRKRVKQSLERTLCSPCPHCEGAGYIKSVQTVIGEILIEAQKIARAIDGKDVMLRVHPDVAKELKSSSNKHLEELEEILGRPVLVKGDATLHHEKFDLG
ncbi:MAG TPA: Rne/Rng family ribonuclease [Bryobacteraceae bacterium]|nr:Rne/Rng family ribonuclease [Bryobacteraceae bacterium]